VAWSPREEPSTKEEIMHAPFVAPLLAALVHGGFIAVPWILGIILIIAGVVALVRRSLLLGIVLIVIGILLGGLNVL
jgi:hypothetical protein